jgi:predicted nucleic acid-binding protein
MRVLLDTNIIIHREANLPINKDIGRLFRWLDDLKYTKCIHPTTVEEIKKHRDEKVVRSMGIKLENYHLMQTQAPLKPNIETLSKQIDINENDINDTIILNELVSDRVDYLITEDRKIHKKSTILGLADRVFTIDAFLEKFYAENPNLVDYKVLSVRKEFFGNININDSFFDSFKEDYQGFEKWFNKKSDEIAYICESTEKKIAAFLYLKVEDRNENYSDISPQFYPKRRLKIGTFKVVSNGFKLGERFLKIIFDNALHFKADEIYVTIFQKRFEQQRLIDLLKDWGFVEFGSKKSQSGEEIVFIRDFSKRVDLSAPKLTYPYINKGTNIFFAPIYPDYHTELFPDSILRTESPKDFIENEPHRNAISKVYVCRSIERNLRSGDIVLFYRTGGYYQGVVSTIGVVENVVTNISSAEQLILLCRKRSVFTDKQLVEQWNHNPKSRPFIVNFLYVYSLNKRLNLKSLIDLEIIKDVNSVPRGFAKISLDNFEAIIKASESNESFIIN